MKLQYDHHQYPGVVPRTFIGPLFISGLVAPFVALLQYFELSKFWAQYLGKIISELTAAMHFCYIKCVLVRTALGLCVIFAFNQLCGTFRKIFGERWLQWFIAITVTQSHFMFYLSRPLPNIFALPLGNKSV